MGQWVEISLQDRRWAEAGLKKLAKRAVRAAMAELGLGKHRISLLGCDDARIAVLNAAFRGKQGPTNVLSWPAVDLSPAKDGGEPGLPERKATLGDVAIAFETCQREALQQGKSLQHHVTHLIVHATLHLIGYDHLRQRDAARMEALETKVLASLGISNPYQDLVA